MQAGFAGRLYSVDQCCMVLNGVFRSSLARGGNGSLQSKAWTVRCSFTVGFMPWPALPGDGALNLEEFSKLVTSPKLSFWMRRLAHSWSVRCFSRDAALCYYIGEECCS